MARYRIFLDGLDTGRTVSAGNYEDAYFDAASTLALTYQNNLELKEMEAGPLSQAVPPS